MPKILLLQFDTDPKAAERRHLLHWVDVPFIEAEPRWPTFFDVVSQQVPDLIVIACSRQPSHAFESARYLGEGFNTRNIPVLLVDVDRKDLERARSSAPRARIVESSELKDAVKDELPGATGKAKIWQPFSDAGRRSIVVAKEEAKRLRAQTLGPEHTLLGVLAQKDSVAAKTLAAKGITLPKARTTIAKSAVLADQSPGDELVFSDSAMRVITLAFEETQKQRHTQLGPEQLLLGIIRQNEQSPSPAISALLGDGKEIAAELQKREAQEAQGRAGAISAAMARRN